ncbi:uncharacterized protein BXZ73DRAFT_97795 [Epithele typhae]|uniref:uncharacterized protein n=1 Tax=Epithele typhae TaxID=378194 RepID=UPI002008B347|nr:uncharacterized protein BXZ73DRAFT_97795 [Epithele typhae]KAH9942383.1 hypothetical protein BXZ73DRAFT_97795 [Epithele typhae]
MSGVKVNTNVKATAVIIGGTGLLGVWISKVFLTDFRSAFPTVRITTRDVNAAKALELAALGAELFSFEDSLDEVLKGADVVINTLPTSVPDAHKKVLAAVAASPAKVYFLSEFGIDHARTSFPGYEFKEWQFKHELAAETRAALSDKKVIALYTSMFLFLLGSPFAPLLGLDIKNNQFKSLGPATTRFTLSATTDIGRAVAQLALLALDAPSAARVPDVLCIAPTTTSTAALAETVARVRGVPAGAVEEEDLEAFRKALREAPAGKTIIDYLRVILGEGAADFSTDNGNELVNPGESLWKWTTVEDELRAGA